MDELTRRFKYHAPNEATKAIHNQLRDEALQFAAGVIEELPGASREKSLAMTKFWAHAHVARNVGREE
jgi:hypothetical protein